MRAAPASVSGLRKRQMTAVLQDAVAFIESPKRFKHVLAPLFFIGYRSTSPMTISMVPRDTIRSAVFWPTLICSSNVRLIRLGGRTR